MSVLYLLVPLGLVLMAVAVAALLWAFGNGQYDDLDEWQQRLPDED